MHGLFFQALDMKQYSARARSRIAAHDKLAKGYLSIAARDRELSKVEHHAMRRWKAEQVRFMRKLESQDVNIKRAMLAAVIQHFCA